MVYSSDGTTSAVSSIAVQLFQKVASAASEAAGESSSNPDQSTTTPDLGTVPRIAAFNKYAIWSEVPGNRNSSNIGPPPFEIG